MKTVLFIIIGVAVVAAVSIIVSRTRRDLAEVKYLLNDEEITPKMLSAMVSDYNIKVRQQDSSLDAGVIRHYFYTM